MFKISNENQSYQTRYFTVTFLDDDDDNSITVDVEPAKTKLIRKINKIQKDTNNYDFDEFMELLSKIFSKNKQKIKVTEYLDDLNIDDLSILIEKYLNWLYNNPNLKSPTTPTAVGGLK